jgi:hypothetical protein
LRIELVVPRRVERVGPVYAFAVAADLHHLRTPCIWLAVRVMRAACDAADADRSGELRILRIADIVLTHLAGAPAGDVEKLVIHGEVDVGDQRRHCAKPLQQRRQLLLRRGLGWDRRGLLDVKLAALAPPGPDRAFEICGVDHDAQKAVLANGIMRGTDFQRHLVVGAEIDRLDIAAIPQVPEMDPVAVFVREEIRRHDPVLELRRQSPLARHHIVARQVPPEIIVQFLRTAIDFPSSEDIERLAIHDEDAGRSLGTILASAAEGTDIDAFRPAVDRVGPRVTGLLEDLLRLDDPVNLRLGGIRFGINDVNPGGPDTGDDEVAALEERVRCKRRQSR